MTKQKFYPAIYVGAHPDARAALASIGIEGDQALLCLSGCDLSAGLPSVFEAYVEDPTARLSDQPLTKTAIVLAACQNGSIGLWFGLFMHLRDSEEEALESLVDELLEHPMKEPPTVNIFEWIPVSEVLQ